MACSLELGNQMSEVMRREDNPFEDEYIAEEWIRSVEGEKGGARDREVYPLLEAWVSDFSKDALVVEIGSGQGICSQHLGTFKGVYIGVEPSVALVDRAITVYGESKNRKFIMGNAYQLPLGNEQADGAFSLNVWFHLKDLSGATQELARILKPGGTFNIITTNPNCYDLWRTFFENPREEGNMISGKVHIPINPLSRNDFYMHTMNEMTESLEHAGLEVGSVHALGTMPREPEKPLFVSIQGIKPIPS